MPDEISIIISLMGISARDWPPNAYQWFRLKEFEDDPEIIAAACDRLLGKLQKIVSSYNLVPSLDEKAIARTLLKDSLERKWLLLDPDTKEEYDNRIRTEQQLIERAKSVHTRLQKTTPQTPTNDFSEEVAEPDVFPDLQVTAPQKPKLAFPDLQVTAPQKPNSSQNRHRKRATQKRKRRKLSVWIALAAIELALLMFLLYRFLR